MIGVLYLVKDIQPLITKFKIISEKSTGISTNIFGINTINSRTLHMAFHDKFEKEDFYLSPEGYVVFTEKYHLKRGYCCQNGCKHCPWRNRTGEKIKKTP
ncbi:hypothetical protein BH11BAC2_BH11BAC2_21740 [soil metagenome]